MSQYFPVFNLGLVYALSHSWRRKWELLKGKTIDMTTEKSKYLSFLKITTSYVQRYCFKTSNVTAARGVIAGFSACNHKLPLWEKSPNSPSAAQLQESHAAHSAAFVEMLFLGEQVAGIQLCTLDVQRQNTDCRLPDLPEIRHKKGRDARSPCRFVQNWIALNRSLPLEGQQENSNKLILMMYWESGRYFITSTWDQT